ncbi:MAG TPA: formyltransferase family protein [Thermomicrobiales bacterium]|jgi:methionyl-tRNA formyltransferase
MNDIERATGLRIATFNVLPLAYGLVARWAEENGHTIALVVTTPGPSTRRTPIYSGVVAMAPPGVDVLVTTRLRRVAQPLIRALAPDLIVSFTFPYRIPPEITAIPRYGAVNLHPTVLPSYRGPNVARPIYEGASEIGGTLHWTEEEYDNGRILSQYAAPLPEDVTGETLMALWPPLMMRAFTEGVARAIAGDPGTPQDETCATYAAPFTDEEHWLNWAETKYTLQRKAVALNLFGPSAAKARIAGEPYRVQQVEALADAGAASPGVVLDRTEDGFVVGVADGAVRVTAAPLTDWQQMR